MSESSLQSEVIRYLRSKGCYVIKTRPGAGVPLGCPDIIFMFEGFWAAIEVKAGVRSPYKPLQLETLKKFNEWSWARRVDPGNWIEVKYELEKIL